MPVHQNKTLDPSHFVVIKPLAPRPPVELKQQDWSRDKHGVSEPSREQLLRGNYHRRQQLSQHACRRPYWEPSNSETVELFGSMKRVENVKWLLPPAHFNLLQSLAREDSSTLKDHLCHVRRLMSAVRQGRGYFQLLQKEAQELQEAQALEGRRREEKRRTECQPPHYDSDSDTERMAFSAGGGRQTNRGGGRRKKLPVGRPFTPIHHSLSSPQLGSVASEPLFRQLCCLNWLLEAATLNPPGRTGPMFSCWDATDPGRSRVNVKALSKEKAVELRWDQFISQPKTRRAPSRVGCSFSGRPLRRASVLSLASAYSAAAPTLLSLSSLALGPAETPPPSGGAAASEESPQQAPQGDQAGSSPAAPEHGQKFDAPFKGAANESPGSKQHGDDSLDSDSPQRQLSAICRFVMSRSAMLEEVRASFQERARELNLSLNDSLDSRARNRWDSGVLTFQSLCHGGPSPPRSRPVTVTAGCRGAQQAVSEPQEDGVWLSRLIADLPETALRDQRVGRLLEKLRRFTDGRSLRITPPAFLRVLAGLQPWELCSPDLCVAIEIVREHAVQMTEEEYDLWLRSRVTLPNPAWPDSSGGGCGVTHSGAGKEVSCPGRVQGVLVGERFGVYLES